MQRNPKDMHEAEAAKMQSPPPGGDGAYNPPEGHQSYYKAELPSQGHYPSPPMTGELQPKIQPHVVDARNSHVELPTAGQNSFPPVELGTGADQR